MANKKSPAEQEHTDLLPCEVTEVLEGVEPSKRREIEKIMISQYSMISRVSPEVEVSKKITSDHITTMLQTQDKAMEHDFDERKSKRHFTLWIVVIACVMVLLIILLLKEQPDLMEKLLTMLISALLGGAGGYGIATYKYKDE